MTPLQRKQHKLGNAQRAFRKALSNFKGSNLTFKSTTVASGLLPRLAKWQAAVGK